MRIISFFTKLLHYVPSELAHNIALFGLKTLHITGVLRFIIDNDSKNKIDKSIKLGNLSFKNGVGIAAGLDKNGDYIDCLAALGVGFIELGTVTPKPQSGNSKPRIFRNIKERSILNRLGFNNKGVDYLVENLKNKKSDIVVGSSIGKNFDTPNSLAHLDYIICLEKVYEHSDYIAVNISSPNTKDLRQLSDVEYFNKLISELRNKQIELSKIHGYKQMFIKISPDEELHKLEMICNKILEKKIDGLICSNTTVQHNEPNGPGGLSGSPLKEKSTIILKLVNERLGDKLAIIASGGVMSASDYFEKIDSGADLVQIYTGFIYEGPKLIQDILSGI